MHQQFHEASPQKTGGKSSHLPTFASLRYRDFRYLWLGNSFTSVASWVQHITLAWLVARITESPAHPDGNALLVGAVLGIRAAPILLVGPLAGVAIDRFNRKAILMAMQLVLVALAFLFAVGVHTDSVNVWHAFLFSFLLGLDLAIIQPVRQSLIANVVPLEDLTNAIALNQSASSIIRIVAPFVGAALIPPLGEAGNFFIQGAAYLAVFLVILPMRTPYREGRVEDPSVVRNLMEGFRYVRADTTLLLLIILVIVPSVFIHSLTDLLVIFAKEIFEGGPLVLGVLGASLGVGALLATFGTASLGNYQKKGLVNMGAITMVCVLLVVFGLSSALVLSLVLIGLIGFFNTGFRLANNSLVQSRIPDRLRGRITSIYLLDHGMIPLGGPILGLVALEYGADHAMFFAGVAALAVTLFMGLRFRQLWRLP